MEKILKTVVIFLIAFATISGALFFVDKDLYRYLIQEDGILENITALVLLVASIGLLIRFLKVYKQKEKPWIFFNLVMIIGLFFGFGEEISWGQRIFNVESGEFFSQNNLQNETNLHNLKIKGVKVNKVIFSQGFSIIFGFYFLFSTLLFEKNQWFRRMITNFGVPIPQIIQSAVFLGLTIFISLVPDQKIWEVWEVLFVLTFFWILISPYNSVEKLMLTPNR